MRAWVIADKFGFENLRIVDRPDPQPGPGQVAVAVRAASLNYRDLLIVRGHYNPKMPLPRVPASDAAGEIVAVGPGVSRVAVGDRVCGTFMQKWVAGRLNDSAAHSALGGDLDGVLSERIVLSEDGVVKYPGYLNAEEAATLPCAALTAWNALAEGGLRAGQTVLLQGTGGVSIFALQIARLSGARILITSSSDEKLARALQMGAHAGLNYRTNADWDKWARAETGGQGVDHVVEVGGAGTLERSFRAVRTGGHIALIGVLTGTGTVNPMPILMRHLTVRGIYVGSPQMFEDMNRAFELQQTRPVVDAVYRFDEFPKALGHLETGGHFGKIVVRVSG
ncbi:MAG: NAD(P)-dependent alcohol dehydrogenase [Zavarzinella sp.]|nr:NAD(P)-dependent alcohol dehydrogenase [Zavarzinella sp.]